MCVRLIMIRVKMWKTQIVIKTVYLISLSVMRSSVALAVLCIYISIHIITIWINKLLWKWFFLTFCNLSELYV